MNGISQSEKAPEKPFCGNNLEAKKLAALISNHPNQKRSEIECNLQLTNLAQQRAEQLATKTADPDLTPNQILIKGGFRVPSYYPVAGNQVEAVAKEFDHVEQVMDYFTTSAKHNNHVLGNGEFFGLQNQIGVGFFKADDEFTQDQWVVLIAEQWQPPQFTFNQKFNMPFKIAKGCETDWENGNNNYLKMKCRGSDSGRIKRKKKPDTQLQCDSNSCKKP